MHLLGLQNKFLNRMLIAATKYNKKPALGNLLLHQVYKIIHLKHCADQNLLFCRHESAERLNFQTFY